MSTIVCSNNLAALSLPADAFQPQFFDHDLAWFSLLENREIFPQIQPIYALQDRHCLLPLQRNSPQQLYGLQNFYTSLYQPLITPDCSVETLRDTLLQVLQQHPCQQIRFDAMDPEHPSFTLLEQALSKTHFKPCRFFCFKNWYLPVKQRRFEDYFTSLHSRMQNTIKRRRKSFLANQRGRLEIYQQPEHAAYASEIWTQIYNRSWKQAEPYPLFMPALIRLCAQQGSLRLGVAFYDDQPVAAQLWIVYQQRASIYKLAYDEQYAKLSAGTVLTAHLMQQVMDIDQVNEVDYLVGDDAYKRDWMDHCRERWGLVAYNTHSLGGLSAYGLQLLSLLRQKYRRHDQPAA